VDEALLRANEEVPKRSGADSACRCVVALAIGVVDVGIDLAGSRRLLFGGLAFALRPLGVLLRGEFRLLCAPGSRLRFLPQARCLLAPLLDLAPAPEDAEHDREYTTTATTMTMIQSVLMGVPLPREDAPKPD